MTTERLIDRLNRYSPDRLAGYPDDGYGDIRDKLAAYIKDMEGQLAYGSETILLGDAINNITNQWPADPEEHAEAAEWWIEAYDSLAEWEQLPGERTQDEVDEFFDRGLFDGESKPQILDDLRAANA